MPFHQIGRLVVEEDGQGEAVVCLHGLGGDSNTFTPLMPALSAYRVVRPDLPGSGRSHAVAGPLDIGRFVEAVGSVCRRLGIERAHFVGHSMGTIVCQHLAAGEPRLVRSLSLFGPLLAPAESARGAIRARGEKARSEGVAGMQEIATTLMNAATSADTRERQSAAAAFVRASLMRQDADGYARSCEALAAMPPAAVDRIACGVLLVTGDEDMVAPPQAVRGMAEQLGGARGVRTVILGRCGHWTPIERPQECMRELREFLTAQR